MKKEVEIEVSARHIHLSKNDYEMLFGIESNFKNLRELSQRNQFVTDKAVTISGSKGELEAKFLSPFRETTQVEVSKTDCFLLGISPPYDIESNNDAAEINISGPAGQISRNAAIVAKRHLHANQKDAAELTIKNNDTVSVKIKTNRGEIMFHDIVVKIRNDFELRVHIDTDEGNAAGISGKCVGELITNENDTNN